RACLAKDPNLRPTMRKGRELLEQANRSLVQGNGKSSDTTALYQRAILTLQDTGSKAQTAYARYALAACLVREDHPEPAIEGLKALAHDCEVSSYVRLQGRVEMLMAQAYTYLNDSGSALEHCRRSRELFERVSDEVSTIDQCTQMSLLYQRTHDGDHALVFLARAFGAAAKVRVTPRRRLG